MTIPEIRAAFFAISDDPRLPKDIARMIRVLAEETKRRSPKKKAAIKHRRATPQLRADIRKFARLHPSLSQLEIGRHFNVNPGRVSEALSGFRQ